MSDLTPESAMTYSEAKKVLNEGWRLGRKATAADVEEARAALDKYQKPNTAGSSVDGLDALLSLPTYL